MATMEAMSVTTDFTPSVGQTVSLTAAATRINTTAAAVITGAAVYEWHCWGWPYSLPIPPCASDLARHSLICFDNLPETLPCCAYSGS